MNLEENNEEDNEQQTAELNNEDEAVPVPPIIHDGRGVDDAGAFDDDGFYRWEDPMVNLDDSRLQANTCQWGEAQEAKVRFKDRRRSSAIRSLLKIFKG